MNPNPKVAPVLRKSFIAVLLGLTLAGEVGCHRAREASFDIAYAADQLGYIAPCGCSQHQLGGAARAALLLEGLADAGPTLFIEGGNFLFDDTKIPAEKEAQDRAKAVALLRSWQVGLGSMTGVIWSTGPFDDSLGAEYRKTAVTDEPVLEAPRVVEIAGAKVGVLNLAGGPDRAAVESLRKRGAAIVLALVHGPMGQASEWVEQSGADVGLQSGVVDPVLDTDEGARVSGPAPVFRVKDKGRGLLVLHVHVPKEPKPGVVVLEGAAGRAAQAEDVGRSIASYNGRLTGADPKLQELLKQKIAELETRRQGLLGPPPAPPTDRIIVGYRFVDLVEDLEQAAPAIEIFKAYTKAIGSNNLAAQANKVCPAVAPGQLHYLGAESCKECHADAYKVYQGSQHPHAYDKLVVNERQYDLDCISCHVVGFGKPGGVCRLDKVEDRAGVQCESCHGMGSAHAESAGATDVPVKKPDYDTCFQCHDPKNDTGFNRQSFVTHYLPLVLGPGHGMPLK